MRVPLATEHKYLLFVENRHLCICIFFCFHTVEKNVCWETVILEKNLVQTIGKMSAVNQLFWGNVCGETVIFEKSKGISTWKNVFCEFCILVKCILVDERLIEKKFPFKRVTGENVHRENVFRGKMSFRKTAS